ncbi:flagellin [Priestia megaterium]|uniref:flagellin N-terminal helical domain-containing protein n=1 Tax=Priestia megaterium TaxID=1404 RepID=UPI00203DD0D7|nr:flagellin [Priestia megaterium]MCM3792518.1 flagellin [Priestia megaterium]
MRINHNIAALNTYRQYNNANDAQSKTMEKLSSGMRINNAADDAAGLSISEKMRGQIRGLDRASSNAQDGISMIKTAEGALNETNDILQRMRELTVQSANDTNTDTDRDAVQKEVDQLAKEIDRIGNTTQFNNKNLLDGSQGQSVTLTNATTKVIKAEVTTDTNEGTYSLQVANKATTAANLTAGGTGATSSDLTITGAGFDVNQSYSIKVEDGTTSGKKLTFTKEDGSVIGTQDNVDVTQAVTLDAAGQNTIGIAASKITGNGTMKFDIGIKADYTVTNAASSQTTTQTVTSTDGKVDIGSFQLTIDKNLTNGTDTQALKVTGQAVQLQIGANEDQNMRIAIRDMRAQNLGVDNIDVSSYSSSKSSITTIDNAIKTVSQERSKLGAYQNRLDHTINNLSTSSENLSSAESRIRDTDMAKTMMEQTKNSILAQASQAMLSQANQQPQQVLQLLR